MDDRYLEAVADSQRRNLLEALAEAGALSDDDLVEAARTNGESTEEFRIRLHHVHLPKLECAGVIEWDRDGTRIAKGENFGAARRLVDALPEDGPRSIAP